MLLRIRLLTVIYPPQHACLCCTGDSRNGLLRLTEKVIDEWDSTMEKISAWLGRRETPAIISLQFLKEFNRFLIGIPCKIRPERQ